MRWASANTPAVSVIMPVHNGVAWLLDAIASVLQQSLGDLELVIVDDGSTDGSCEAIDCLVRRDRRIRVLRQRHLGVAAALNRGLEAARAPFVARLDADDTAEAARLERQAAFLERRREVRLVGT
jgi:glycosyltransferase involved in cell wall biosynthesis